MERKTKVASIHATIIHSDLDTANAVILNFCLPEQAKCFLPFYVAGHLSACKLNLTSPVSVLLIIYPADTNMDSIMQCSLKSKKSEAAVSYGDPLFLISLHFLFKNNGLVVRLLSPHFLFQ